MTVAHCSWCKSETEQRYHDLEWGIPLHDDRGQFEFLMMEVMQCGLSWSLMLKKREIFRRCFDSFDFEKISEYGEQDILRILNTEGMIRSQRKIEAVINNAVCFRKIREEYGSFSEYIWSYSGGKTVLYDGHGDGEIPACNGLSDEISRDLKKRGFKYLGSVTVYAHLQACGIVNDHGNECPCYKKIVEQYPTVRMEKCSER